MYVDIQSELLLYPIRLRGPPRTFCNVCIKNFNNFIHKQKNFISRKIFCF